MHWEHGIKKCRRIRSLDGSCINNKSSVCVYSHCGGKEEIGALQSKNQLQKAYCSAAARKASVGIFSCAFGFVAAAVPCAVF